MGTRGSRLARIQTDLVLDRLRAAAVRGAFEVSVIRTAGDEDPGRRPARVTGQGIFTRTIEQALLDRRIDVAVHSLKDLPTESPPGLVVAAIPGRDDSRDVLVGCRIETLVSCPGVRIGTSSLRRASQLRRAFPGCNVIELRGNLETRLRKIGTGHAEGAVLAAAGLRRLGRNDVVTHIFAPETILPAPGQGALGVQIRADDVGLHRMLRCIHCERAAACVVAERTFLHALGGGCRAPVGALADVETDSLHLRGRILSLDGSQCFEGELSGKMAESAAIGRELASALLSSGAGEMLRQIQREVEHG